MGCQPEIASQIIEQKGDYVLAFKGNQGNLLKEVEDSFNTLKYDTTSEELDMGNGRVETRKCSVISDLQLIENKEQWSGLKSIARIESERYFKVDGKIETEIRYYIC